MNSFVIIIDDMILFRARGLAGGKTGTALIHAEKSRMIRHITRNDNRRIMAKKML